MATLKKRLLIFFLTFSTLIAVVTATLCHSRLKSKDCIIVGAKNGTEELIVSEIIAQFLEAQTSLKVMRRFHLDGTYICFEALKSKEIDLYVEYTGTALTAILKQNDLRLSEGESLAFLKQEFKKRFNLIWLDPLGYSCSYVLITHPDFASSHQIETLSDLQALLERDQSIRVAFDPEFYGRPEKNILENQYGMRFSNLTLLEHSLLYLTLLNHSMDVIVGYSTDGFILAHHLKRLSDDAKQFPSYSAVPLIRAEVIETHPEVGAAIRELAGRIDFGKICQMNYEVEKNGKNIYDVAQNFLNSQ